MKRNLVNVERAKQFAEDFNIKDKTCWFCNSNVLILMSNAFELRMAQQGAGLVISPYYPRLLLAPILCNACGFVMFISVDQANLNKEPYVKEM